MCDLQNKHCHLGLFQNPIDAAKRYDEEAIKIHGARAHLNFLPDGTPTYTGARTQSILVRGGEGCLQEGPARNEVLPAGNGTVPTPSGLRPAGNAEGRTPNGVLPAGNANGRPSMGLQPAGSADGSAPNGLLPAGSAERPTVPAPEPHVR
jgi:hypothetical protein